MPGWMKAMDSFTTPRSFVMGAVLSGLNPKNLILTLGAGAAIAQTGVPMGEQFVALAVFVLVGMLGPGLPVAIYFLAGSRAEAILDDVKDWMIRHNAAIMTVLCLVIGMKLIGDAIGGLAAA